MRSEKSEVRKGKKPRAARPEALSDFSLHTSHFVVPRLRFPEFRTESGWATIELRRVSAFVNERVGATSCTPYTVTSGVGLVSQQEKLGRTIAGNSLRNYVVLQKNDFAYNKSATKAFPQGFIARYVGDERAAVPNSIFTCFRTNEEAVDPTFLDNLFSTNLHGQWLRSRIAVGARAHGSLNVSDDDLMSLPVPVPQGESSLAEQQKIADCLTSLDEVIAAQGRKVEALKAHKRGLMQQLFPREGETRPRLRFPEFRDAPEWIPRPLDELAKRGSGHTPSKSHPEYYNGGIKWVSLADSKQLDSGFISETAVEISQKGIANSSAVLHPAGSVILCRDAGVGKSAVMKDSMAVSQHFMAWICDPAALSNWFLYYLFQLMKPIFEDVASGSTIKTIGFPFFKELKVVAPQLAEQHRIADCLSSLDAQITAESDQLAASKTHKQGLMQQLFPAPAEADT